MTWADPKHCVLEAFIKRLIIAAVITIAYVVFAIGIVHTDRTTSTGGFISLQGLVSALVTFPVAFPLEFMGQKLDYQSNLQMGAAIFVCAVIVFGLSYGALSLAESLWVAMRAAPRSS